MLKADQRGQWMVNIFIKLFAVIGPITISMEFILSAVYSLLKFGYINLDVLFRPYQVMYDISKVFPR